MTHPTNTLDWTAPVADLHDELVEIYCDANPNYDPEDDDFKAANDYADDQIARRAL